MAHVDRKWWKESVVYQIYPSSFKDSNGDGLGDIPGIISKVDYLASLGVDAIWLSPFLKSPQVDMGYDISDYREVHAPYGTVADVEHLIAELKKHNMRLLMDLVVNHTSDQHPWFLESKSSLDSPKRDWYIWRKPGTGPKGEPNNWESLFKGSAWTLDPTTNEYYFHIFAVEQPCLNWENVDLRAAIYEDMHFWLQKGLGGLRMDAINLISKPSDLSDAPIVDEGEYQSCFSLVANRDPMHAWLSEMKEKVLDHYDDIATIGECGGTEDIEETLKFIRPERNELDVIFQFELTEIDKGPDGGTFAKKDWTLGEAKKIVQKWQTKLRPAWNTFHLENHDGGRSVNRYGHAPSPVWFPAVSKMLGFFMLTLGGTIFLHQGQEIGAQNLTADVPLSEYKDVATQSEFQKWKAARTAASGGKEPNMDDVMTEVLLKARDHGRVPMAWDDGDGAGFTTGQPWMTLGSTYKEINVAHQEEQRDSVLKTWRDMIKFRREHADTLVYGKFELVDEKNEQVFAYTRTAEDGTKLLIALNWSHLFIKWEMPFIARNRKMLKKVGNVRDAEGNKIVELGGYVCVCWQI